MTLVLLVRLSRLFKPNTNINRYLFVCDLATPVNLSDVKDKVAWVNVDTTDSSVLTGSCTVYGWNNTKFSLSIQEL